MLITDRPGLLPEEKATPLAKYYELPLHSPAPLQMQIINASPMDPADAIKVEDFLDLLHPTDYMDVELGCCLMPDGSGHIAAYTLYPYCDTRMLGWWFRWLNVRTPEMPAGNNVKYKIWNPVDHVDHGFINGKDKSEGIYQVEALDMGGGEAAFYSIRHPFSLRDYGLTEEREKELGAAGCWVDCAVEKFYTPEEPHALLPGTHLTLTLSRACPTGGVEKRTREWIGYGVKDGEIYFDESTPDYMLSMDYMKNVLYHNTVEAQRLGTILPELYAEYHDKPDDEL